MQRVMNGLAMLLSVAVLALMAVDLRRFIVEQHIAPFTVDSPLAFIIFVMSLLTVFIVINGIQDMRRLKTQDHEDGDARQGACALLWVLVFMAVVFFYVYMVKHLHFLLTTLIFMGLGMFLLNDTEQKLGVKLARVLLATGITVPVLFAIFNYAFDVVLP